MCESTFLLGIMLLLPQIFPLIFLIVQVCWQWILSIFCLFLRKFFFHIFAGYRTLVNSLYFSTLSMSLHGLLAWLASDRKSSIILIFVPVYIMNLSPSSSKYFLKLCLLFLAVWHDMPSFLALSLGSIVFFLIFLIIKKKNLNILYRIVETVNSFCTWKWVHLSFC